MIAGPRVLRGLALAFLSSLLSVCVGGVSPRSFLMTLSEAKQALLGNVIYKHKLGAERLDGSGDPLFAHFADLVTPHSYAVEQHFVTTPDGYILRLFRLPGGRGSGGNGGSSGGSSTRPAAADSTDTRSVPRRPPVLLQHGLLDSPAAFVLNGPGHGLAFVLADEGYDVWLPSARGSTYSANHSRLRPTDADFWAFSFDEMALVDLPACVEEVCRLSGAPRLSYIGHSQGTMVLLTGLAARPQLAARLHVAALLAPVASVRHMASLPLEVMADFGTDGLFTILGFHQFLPSQELVSLLTGQLCRLEPALCLNILTAICGYNPDNLDSNRLPLYLKYTPAGTSVQNMVHWSQAVRLGPLPPLVRRFDFGTRCEDPASGMPLRCNQLAYNGSEVPPAYDLSRVAGVPLALFTGGQDRLATPLDVEYLLESLPPGAVVYRHDEPDYEHIDFTWGANAAERIYGRLLQLLAQY